VNVLISSLGETPAVVTETVDALEQEEHVQIKQVVTIGTNGYWVDRSREVLREEFREFEGARIGYIPDQIEAQDVVMEADHLEFLTKVATWLRWYQKEDVYLSLAGGRKTMSALMAIAAQIYGAKLLCHVVPLSEDLERQGEIRTWFSLRREQQQRVLHPPADTVRLVRLPLLSLFPLLNDFIHALQGQMDGDPQAAQLLENSGLIRREQGQTQRTPSGEQLFTVLSDVEQLPPSSPLRPDEKERPHEAKHGFDGKFKRVKEWADRLATLPWVSGIKTIEYSPRPRTAIRHIRDDGHIEIDVKIGEFSAGLEVRTTAQTKGQTERVARELEKLLK